MPRDLSRADLFLSQELGVLDPAAARARLATSQVALAISPELAADRGAQLALLMSADILCRLGPYCPNIAILAPAAARVAAGVPLLAPGAPLAADLSRYMVEVQPPNQRAARHHRPGDPNEPCDVALVIGATEVPGPRRILYGWYERWTGGFAHAPRGVIYRGPNPFGALLAGALGATAVGRLLLGSVADPSSAPGPLPDAAALSAYSYARPERPEEEPDLPPVVDLRLAEPALLVGAGAVGSGVALALAALDHITGTLHVADGDTLDGTNLERHLVSTWCHVGDPKAARLDELFAGGEWNGLRVIPETRHYEDLAARPWRTVVAAVDTPEARRRLQFDLPRVLLNAGTVGPELLVSRHDYGRGPCAECLYPERPPLIRSATEVLAAQSGLNLAEVLELLATGAELTTDQVARVTARGGLVFAPETLERARQLGIRVLVDAACTTAQVRPGLPVATIGFVAALPGLLLAAELIKEALTPVGGDRPSLGGHRNVFRLDTFRDLQGELEAARPSRGCRCQDAAMQSAYGKRWVSWAPDSTSPVATPDQKGTVCPE